VQVAFDAVATSAGRRDRTCHIAEVTVDGQRWVTADEGHFMLQMPAGKHRVEISKAGYRTFIEVGDGETVPLNVSLMMTSS
jgi:hypothetical protein